MKLERSYQGTKFAPEVLAQAEELLLNGGEVKSVIQKLMSATISDGDEWKHDDRDEFFADYRKTDKAFYMALYRRDDEAIVGIDVVQRGRTADVAITAPDRTVILKAFGVFEAVRENSKLPEEPEVESEPTPISIFIGHGRQLDWRDLKDHLHDKWGYRVTAYEVGARAGHEIRDVLENMMNESSFAIMVMTAEDETPTGKRARQNVIHETGLFQGHLGFEKVILLKERGVESFSNINGVTHLPFSKGKIDSTFGDVLAVIKREFPD